MSRHQREEFFHEAALWFQWAADACRRQDAHESRKCGITAMRVVWRLFHTDGRLCDAQKQPAHLSDGLARTAGTTDPIDRLLDGSAS